MAFALPGYVTFYGGVVGLDTLLVPFPPGTDRLTVAVRYPCGCTGYDQYDRLGDIALYVYHEPAPKHRTGWVDSVSGPPLEGDEWKNAHHKPDSKPDPTPES